MSAKFVRILDSLALNSAMVTPRDQVADLGAYGTLHVVVRVLKAGSATDANAVVKLQHATVNEDGAFIDLAGTSVRVDSAAAQTPTYVEVPGFTRFVRWATGTGSFAGGPVAQIDIVAKD